MKFLPGRRRRQQLQFKSLTHSNKKRAKQSESLAEANQKRLVDKRPRDALYIYYENGIRKEGRMEEGKLVKSLAP